MSQHRLQRVSRLVKQQVGEILQSLTLADCGFVTVTDVQVAADLREGRVFVSVIGSADQQQRALARLQHQHGLIQRELAHRIVLKYTPRLTFLLDDTETRAAQIEHLLDELDQPDSA
ncbi:30S ribosome-binding factor RbfA [bacterium]|nr:30S ribosome-binding factor RbfA [bacterium]